MWLSSILPIFWVVFSSAGAREEVIFTLGDLGPVRGVVTATKAYPEAPYSERHLYKFRNMPYIEGSIAGQNRFTQSSVRVSPYTEDGTAYDATRSGPMCMQGTLGSLHLDQVFEQTLEDFIISILPPIIGDLDSTRVVVEVLLQVIEIFVEVPAGTLNGKKPVVEILHDWLDIDFSVAEECLSLAVWTPIRPDGEERKQLPVMYYLFGGGFNSGFSYRMGGERLAAFEDVVVVAINYRLGPLGFLCLDTEEAAGNQSLLDMVVGLEWVQNYIAYFGGDPTRVTLFGDSAGAASAGHLMLSQEATGLFHQAIGASGSAIASWAWDTQDTSEACSRQIAAIVGCTHTDSDQLVDCLRQVDAEDITAAFSEFQAWERGNASMGYCGTQPCGQTKGPRFFYTEEKTPTDILMAGDYHPVPVMYGAAKDEGSFIYGTLYTEWMVKNNQSMDPDFLRHEVVPTLMKTMDVSNYYPMKELLRDIYFDQESLGDLHAMIPGFTDLIGVFAIKAASYELMQQNSLHAPSFWYDFHYDSLHKHLYNVFFLGSQPTGVDFPGATHCEELPYMFDVEIPLIFCNLTEIVGDALNCFDGLDAVFCLTLPGGEFRSKWKDCLTGHLTGDDLQVSANVAQTFAGFAARGQPGFGLPPWTQDQPQYLRIDKEMSVESDYTKQYNIALEQSRNRTQT